MIQLFVSGLGGPQYAFRFLWKAALDGTGPAGYLNSLSQLGLLTSTH